VIVQLLPTSTIDIQGKPPHRPRRTLWSTDRNIPPRIPVQAPIPADGVARFNLSRAQATTLAGRLLDALEQNDQNPIEVPPAYNYGEEFAHIITEGLGIPPAVAAEGLGIRGGRRQRQNQGRGGQPQQLPDAQRPANPPQAQASARQQARRPVSPTPLGFKHNQGPAFIPFRIQENGCETPARYICVTVGRP
jgi:hypothetical protein